MRVRQNNPISISTSRWLAYASAGAATMLTSVSSADAGIHYSGRVDFRFGPDENKSATFPLEQSGNYLLFTHHTFGRTAAAFQAVGLQSGSFVG